MSTLPSRPPANGARGGSSRSWTRGGGGNGAGAAGAPPVARNQSAVFNSSGAVVSSRGAARGSSLTRGRGRGRGGVSGVARNALELAGALADNEDPSSTPSADFADNDNNDASLGNEQLPSDDDEETKADKADARLQRFTSKFEGNRFEELRAARGKLREEAMRTGAIDDPSVPRSFSSGARPFTGTCEGMCPEFEIEEREAQFNVDRWELLAGTTNRIDHSKAVKMYHRPAAGNEQPLPSDVRTPEALRRTLDYLFTLFPASGPPSTLRQSHGFIRDRMRSIRQDFTIQSSKGAIAIECHERMARYHIHCLHVLGGEEGFSVQQEMEQLRKILTSLVQYYTDVRNATPSTSTSFHPPATASVHEAEFSAYLLITHLFDSDILRQTESLPPYLFHTAEIQLALELAYLAQRAHDPDARAKPTSRLSQNFFTRFFKAVQRPSTPYLVAALVEGHFGEVRKAGLLALKKVYMKAHKAMPVQDLALMLGADDEDDLRRLLSDFGVKLDEDGVKLWKEAPLNDNRPAYHLRTSRRIVGVKSQGWTNLQIINGEASLTGVTPSLTPASRSRTTPTGSVHIPCPSTESTFKPAQFQPKTNSAAGARLALPKPLASTVTPPDADLPTPSVSSFASAAPSPSPSPLPTATSAALFAPSPSAFTPSPPPLSPAASAPSPPIAVPKPTPLLRSTSSLGFGLPGSVPLTAADKGKSRDREPPKRFQEIIVASPSAHSESSAVPTPLPPISPAAPVKSTTVLEPLPPLRAPRPRTTPQSLVSQFSLNARLAANLTDELVKLATTPLLKSIASRALSQEVLDRSEAEDAREARAKQAQLEEAVRRREQQKEEEAARRKAMLTAADEFAARALGRRTLIRMWDAVLRGDERREREAEFKLKVEHMGLGKSVARTETAAFSESVGEDARAAARPVVNYREVETRMTELGKSRAAFWEPSTFLHTLLDHLSSLHRPPPSTPPLQYDVIVSTVPTWTQSRAGSWLASKFGLKKDAREAERVRGREVQLSIGDVNAIAGSQYVGLVVFECSPPSAPTGDADDVERLQDVLDRISEDNLYAPALLVVGWTPSLPPLLERALRNSDTPDYHVLILDSAEADDAFSEAVQSFVRVPEEVQRPTVPIREYLDAVWPTWASLLDLGLDVISRLPPASPSIALTIDKLLAAINEHSARVLAVVTDSQDEVDELYIPHFSPSSPITDDSSLAVALLEYLDLSRFTDETTYDALRTDVRLAYYSHSVPPLQAFVETLFASTASRLAALPDVPERKFGDARGVDEMEIGFAEWVGDAEAEIVRMGNAERRVERPAVKEVDPAPPSSPAPPSPVKLAPLDTARTPLKRAREPADDQTPIGVSAFNASSTGGNAEDGDGASGGKFAKLRRIMQAARGML